MFINLNNLNLKISHHLIGDFFIKKINRKKHIYSIVIDNDFSKKIYLKIKNLNKTDYPGYICTFIFYKNKSTYLFDIFKSKENYLYSKVEMDIIEYLDNNCSFLTKEKYSINYILKSLENNN